MTTLAELNERMRRHSLTRVQKAGIKALANDDLDDASAALDEIEKEIHPELSGVTGVVLEASDPLGYIGGGNHPSELFALGVEFDSIYDLTFPGASLDELPDELGLEFASLEVTYKTNTTVTAPQSSLKATEAGMWMCSLLIYPADDETVAIGSSLSLAVYDGGPTQSQPARPSLITNGAEQYLHDVVTALGPETFTFTVAPLVRFKDATSSPYNPCTYATLRVVRIK